MCRIVFSGELLDGFQLQDVQKAAAIRLRVDDQQLARLFSGEPTVLKKAVSHEACAPYVVELARMGMKARVESLAPLNAAQAQEVTFKVVFWGKVIKGYTKDQVMRAAPRRLRVDEAQVVRLFSGGKAVLKRGVSAEAGGRYVTELARIGMQVELEIEVESLPLRNSTASQVLAFNSSATGIGTAPLVDEDNYGSFLQTQVDLQGTGTLFSTDIMGASAGHDARLSEPVEPPKLPPAAAKQQVVERLASAIEQAYAAELGPRDGDAIIVEPPPAKQEAKSRCPQCGHRQFFGDKGGRCDACGFEVEAKRKVTTFMSAEEMTRSLHDEMVGGPKAVDEATLMREMRHQKPKHHASQRHVKRLPVLIGSACVLAVAGWAIFH